MHSVAVISKPEEGAGEDAESFRIWAWHAVKQAGGDVTINYKSFLNTQGAVLFWSIDPVTLDLRIVAA